MMAETGGMWHTGTETGDASRMVTSDGPERTLRTATVQMAVCPCKGRNLEHAASLLDRQELEGADLVTLPEMFTCPYDTADFPVYAEEEGGPSWRFCADLAASHRVYLVAGSMPEVDGDGLVYNTSYVFDREGRQIAKHRKMHLFDIDIEGGQRFRESDTLHAGHEATVFPTEFCTMGLALCFDIRFPELFLDMAHRGAELIVVPASFNMTTGPLHWELLFRARAVDDQVFCVGTSSAWDGKTAYVPWGHSIITGPWGDVKMQMGADEGVAVTEVDLGEVCRARRQLPLLSTRR